MSVEFGVWRIDNGLQKLSMQGIDFEKRLEDLLVQDITLAAPHLMVIGRQVRTAHGKDIDLLAMDATGNLAVLELKRAKTYRDIVAQVLDYGSWVCDLEDEQIASIYSDFQTKHFPDDDRSIDEAFRERFSAAIPDALNENHQLIIVASELDPSTERVVGYLAEQFKLDINVIFFQFVQDEGREYLCRAWLREPTPISDVANDNNSQDWNGEFYVSFGHGDHRRWDEAVKYGFISAGGGDWYTKTLLGLPEGKRFWVNIPSVGYVGVGEFCGERQHVKDFTVETESGPQPIIQLSSALNDALQIKAGEDEAEYLVPVRWLKTVPYEQAIKEKGFFGNQNTVARPVASKWEHTVSRLKQRFQID